ncbi:hypothetical protein Tco_0407825 [Tanacetum coccineum]
MSTSSSTPAVSSELLTQKTCVEKTANTKSKPAFPKWQSGMTCFQTFVTANNSFYVTVLETSSWTRASTPQCNNGKHPKSSKPPVVQIQSRNPNPEPNVSPVDTPIPKASILFPSRRNDERRKEKADFVVVEFEPDPRVPLILGRCFLKTSRALIDVYEGEITLRVGKEAITFNLDQTSRYTANFNHMTANRIDVIDMASEEYSQEVLGFSDSVAYGNPSPCFDPIVANSSPTLTPFGESDFLLFEEANAFLALDDDTTSPEVDPTYYGIRREFLILEAFLNNETTTPLFQIRRLFTRNPRRNQNFSDQKMVNPKIHDVNQEMKLKKLLDAGFDTYPISDSPLGQPIHCVPKKGPPVKDHFPPVYGSQLLEEISGKRSTIVSLMVSPVIRDVVHGKERKALEILEACHNGAQSEGTSWCKPNATKILIPNIESASSLSTAYHPQTSGPVDGVKSWFGLKRILDKDHRVKDFLGKPKIPVGVGPFTINSSLHSCTVEAISSTTGRFQSDRSCVKHTLEGRTTIGRPDLQTFPTGPLIACRN